LDIDEDAAQLQQHKLTRKRALTIDVANNVHAAASTVQQDAVQLSHFDNIHHEPIHIQRNPIQQTFESHDKPSEDFLLSVSDIKARGNPYFSFKTINLHVINFAGNANCLISLRLADQDVHHHHNNHHESDNVKIALIDQAKIAPDMCNSTSGFFGNIIDGVRLQLFHVSSSSSSSSRYVSKSICI
jgi:hypothetical protein